MLSFVYNLVKILLILVLPFIILIRGAVYFHLEQGFFPSISILISAGITALLLVIYFSVIYGKFTKKRAQIKYLRRRFAVIFMLVGFFVLYGIVNLSSSNAKSTQVQKEFTELHPILRLSCSTIFLLDRKAIMTDASRVPEDYKKMGLSKKSSSLHYKQKDGYVHAVDLRTNGRWEIRNKALEYYFRIMGFKTLRHVGTADHLHVGLPVI